MKYIFTLFLLLSSACFSSELPAPPSGYTWYNSKSNVGVFLVPEKWHVKEEKNKDTNALFITQEKIETGKSFLTGLSVNQINNFKEKSKKLPSVYAKEFIIKVSKDFEVINSFTIPNTSGEMSGVQVIGSNNNIPTILHYLAMGHDKENKLYILIFETPEELWLNNSKIAFPMLNMFGLGE
jgi:hypothetical protein